mmetsp:Transcript_18441/g.29554  ORF Transcript_18441/g.29554 Transcript_18441/m.29554 type:complete len:402 (+) Transcript_18441:171-1376(+)
MTSATKASGDLVWLGIVLGVFASMTGTIGKQLLRFSELLKQKGLTYNSKVAWTIGILLNTVVGPIVDMTSYAFAPQSLIAPLGGLDVVWNTLSAPFTLGEKLNKTIVFGVVLIAGGATGTSLFGNHDDKDYTVDIITDTFTRWIILVYLSILFVWLAFNILVLQKRSANPKGQPWITGDPIRGLSLGMTAGSISGNMFCVKGFVELVQASIRDEDASIWAHYLPYVLLVGAILFAVTNVFFLDKATREYNALFMGAVFEGSLIVCAAVSGVVVYADLDELEWYQRICYFVCLFSIVVGVLIVARGSHRDGVEEAVEAVTANGVKVRETNTIQGLPRSTLTKTRRSFLFELLEDAIGMPSREADDTEVKDVAADAGTKKNKRLRQPQDPIGLPNVDLAPPTP